MRLLRKLIWFIVLVVMSPFKLLNKIFQKIEDISDDHLSIIYTVVNASIFILVALKFGLADGKWIVTLLVTLLICSVANIVLTFGLAILILIIKEATKIQSQMFDRAKDKIYQVDVETNEKKKQKEEKKEKKEKEIMQQDEAGVSLAYFINREKNISIPYIKYLGD